MAGGGVRETEQVVTRTPDRVHVSLGDGHEWLFERNPVDPRRAAAMRTDPASRAVVVYDESELRTHRGVRGWADVLMLGFDPVILAQAVRQQDDRSVDGLRFSRFTTSVDRGTRDIWWSPEHLLALSFELVDAEGRATFTIRRVRPGVDAALLQPLSSRFPRFEVVEVADLLERH
jgi:hypothetical protein